MSRRRQAVNVFMVLLMECNYGLFDSMTGWLLNCCEPNSDRLIAALVEQERFECIAHRRWKFEAEIQPKRFSGHAPVRGKFDETVSGTRHLRRSSCGNPIFGTGEPLFGSHTPVA